MVWLMPRRTRGGWRGDGGEREMLGGNEGIGGGNERKAEEEEEGCLSTRPGSLSCRPFCFATVTGQPAG